MRPTSSAYWGHLRLILTFKPTLCPCGQADSLRCQPHKNNHAHALLQYPPVMLRLQQTDNRQIIERAPERPGREERAACFAVLLILSFSVAMMLSRPSIQKREKSATPLPFSGTTQAKDFLVPTSQTLHQPSSFLAGPSIALVKAG